MRLLIIYTRAMEQLAEHFLDHALKQGLICVKWLVHGDNREELIRLYEKMNSSTHYLFIINRELFHSQWFFFACGYCLGKGNTPSVLLDKKQQDELQAGTPLVIRYDVKEIVEDFLKVKEVFETQTAQQAAKNFLLNSGFGLSNVTLIEVVKKGDIEALYALLVLGFSMDTTDELGVPILCLAVRHNQYELTKHLLELGADINKQSKDRGNSALMDASVSGLTAIVDLLLSAGADLNLQSKNGQTALVLAIGGKSTDIVHKLIRAGADTTIKDSLGMTAKKYAELFKKQDLIPLL